MERNLDKWGIDAEHNCLFITGNAGSGKSTEASKYDACTLSLDFCNYISKEHIEDLSKKLYAKKKRFIVEGWQIASPDFWEGKLYFKDKPIIILETDVEECIRRVMEREELEDCTDEIRNWFNMVEKYLEELKRKIPG